MDEREAFVKSIIDDKNSRILEIGPLHRPIITKDEYPNSFYCDIRSTEQVKALYSGNDYLETTGIRISLDEIVDIDYVLKDSYQETFSGVEKFDYFVASHVMEHVEDLITFLQDVATVLNPEGKLCIIYPDKRYCFDHFREAASFRDAYDVYTRGQHETARMVLDFFNTSIDENMPSVFWGAEDMHLLLSKNDSGRAIEAYKKALSGEKPDDVHFWPFTDYGFLRFLYDCVRAKLIPFTCVRFHPTAENSQQFLVELKYDSTVLEQNEDELVNLINLIRTVPLDYHNSKHLELERNNAELNDENVQLREKLSEVESSNAALTIQYEQLTTAHNELEKQNILLNSNVNFLTQKNAQLVSDVESLQTIENSTIWRVTKPVRVVLDIIKKPFKKNN